MDATMRLVPGVLGNEASGEFESFGAADAEIEVDVEGVPRSQHGAGGLLDYPHYTRPAEFMGLRAPEGADERRSRGDQALAAAAAVAEDSEEPAGSAGRRGAERGGSAVDRGDAARRVGVKPKGCRNEGAAFPRSSRLVSTKGGFTRGIPAERGSVGDGDGEVHVDGDGLLADGSGLEVEAADRIDHAGIPEGAIRLDDLDVLRLSL